jgi:hypothetical protein
MRHTPSVIRAEMNRVVTRPQRPEPQPRAADIRKGAGMVAARAARHGAS